MGSNFTSILYVLCTQLLSKNLSLSECHTLQMEEIETLKAILEDNMSTLNEDGTCFVTQISEGIKDKDVIKIQFRFVWQINSK